jgi:hypothetical protein
MSAEVSTEINEVKEVNGKTEASLNNEPKQNGNKSKKIENDDSENEDSVEE